MKKLGLIKTMEMGRKLEEYAWAMQRDMKHCKDLTNAWIQGSNNAKGYITQRIVVATQ